METDQEYIPFQNKVQEEPNNFTEFGEICTECNSDDIIEDRSSGFHVCRSCGLQQRPIVDAVYENSYTNEFGVVDNKNNGHCSRDASNPFDDGSLPFYPAGWVVEFTGKSGQKIKYDMSRLNVRHIPHKQKAFYHVSQLLKTACEKLGSHVMVLERAKAIWGTIAKTGIVKRGGNRKGLIGNCLLYSTHVEHYPRTQDQVAEALYMKTADITRSFKIFRDILTGTDMEFVLDSMTGHQSRFGKFVRELSAPYKFTIMCEKLYRKHEDSLSVVAPNSAVAGILYYILNKDKQTVSKQRIKECIGVCIPTLNKVVILIKNLETSSTKTNNATNDVAS